MKRFYLNTVSTALALGLISAPLAMAQQAPNHPPPANVHGDDNHPPQQHAVETHSSMPPQHTVETHAPVPPQQSHMVQAPEQHNYTHPAPMPPPQHYANNGGGHQWHHGDHYTDDRQVVGNWQHYHLNQPPEGYEWVQDGSQFVLIAVASGIIADVILNSSYQ